MKTTIRLLTIGLILLTLNSQLSTLFAQGTAFTYQGRLNNGANPATGSYDLTFTLFGSSSGGSAVAGPLTNAATGVSNGLFSVTLDFGNQFPGTDRWLEIGVRTNGGGAFATLSPRQQLTSTPYAIQSANAASASSVAATNVTGTIGDARLSANVALLNANQTFTGTNLFTGNIGIGTNSPQAPLHVAGVVPDFSGAVLGVQTGGTINGGGVYGRSLLPAGNGVIGEADVNGPAQPIGVWGITYATGGVGVYGSAWANTGTPTAIAAYAGTNGYAGYFQGRSYFSDKVGMGTNNPQAPLHVAGPAPDGNGVILGVQTGGGTGGAGVFGRSLLAGGNGVYGEADVPGVGGSVPVGVGGFSAATNGVGVYASASANTGTPLAILALASTNGYAGFFQGRSYFSDKVGIGTTSPGRLLQLGSPTSTVDAMISFGCGNGPVGRTWEIGVPYGTNNANGQYYSFAIRDTGNPIPSIFAQYYSGYVGIGTISPAATLDVNGSAHISSNLTLGGNIGLNGAAPNFPLSFPDVFGDKIELWGNSGGNHYGFGVQTNQLQIHTAGSGDDIVFGYGQSTNLTETMRITGAGNVGIGANPANFPLTFAQTTGDKISLYSDLDGTNHYGFGITNLQLQIHTDGSSADVVFGWGSSANLTETMRIKGNGNVGIGTATPTKGSLEIDTQNGNVPGYSPVGYLLPTGAGTIGSVVDTGNVSIWAQGWVFAKSFVAFSDQRIKNIKGQSDSAADLKTLLGIKVTDFTYKDTIAKGNAPQKKVIAQQVEQVYPQAVTKSTDVVPDIYRKATLKDGWVQLATDLKVGERVKLIGEKEKGVYPVLEVRDGAFRTDFKSSTEQVFVYGREVSDFRNVDYEAIAMLNVSATQELAHRLKSQQEELTEVQAEKQALLKRLSVLEARDQARENRLARMESALQKGSDGASYVSLKRP